MATLRVVFVAVCAVVSSVSLCGAQGQRAGAEADSWIVLQQGLAQDVCRYEIPLSLSESSPSPLGRPQSEEVFEVLDAPEQGYTQRVDFDPAPVGGRYSLLLRPATEIKWLSSQGSSGSTLLQIAILQGREENDLEVVKEGYVSQGQSFSLPIKVPADQLDLRRDKPVRGSVEFRLNLTRPETYRARMTLNVNAFLVGSMIMESVRVDVTMECAGFTRLEDRQIRIQVRPLERPQRSDAASGKIADILTLQTSSLVVEKIASDYSKVSLAAVDGKLGQPRPDELLDESRRIMPQRPLPRFARVDLIRRRLVSLDDLCAEAGDAGCVVLVFGDHAPVTSDYNRGLPRLSPGILPLDEDLICGMLRASVEKPVVVAFACKRFDSTTLYERWLGNDPNFYVISDFSQPSYALGSRDPSTYYARGRSGVVSQAETLCGKFALPEDQVAVVLVDGSGLVLHVELDAQDKLEQVLTGINERIRGLFPTSDPNQAAGPEEERSRG